MAALYPAIPSMSLGQPRIHSLPSKLHQASRAGFTGIELFIDDLTEFATREFNSNSLAAASHIRTLCTSLNLSIICLQPFTFYEGLLDRSQHSYLLNTKLPHWFSIAHALGTDLIQVPSNFLPSSVGPGSGGQATTSGDTDLIVSDLQKLADSGAAQDPPIRFVYEALAWGNHVYTWEKSWEIVQLVNRPNLGLCLDTFHILSWVYADPGSKDGVRVDAKERLQTCLEGLRREIDPKKVFYVQVVDGERLSGVLDETHPFYVSGRPSRMSWSRNARLFAFEEHRGGYLPVLEVVRAFIDFGFSGWVSLELFSRFLGNEDPDVPREYAKRGIESWEKLVKKIGLDCPRGESAPVQHHL